MNKTVAILLTLVSVLLCGCPGLYLLFSVVLSFFETPEQIFSSVGMTPPANNINTYLWGGRIIDLVATIILLVIPIVVGLVTLRRGKKQTV